MEALVVAMAQLGKEPAIDMEVTGSNPVFCRFLFPTLSSPCVVLQLIFHLHHHGTQTISISILYILLTVCNCHVCMYTACMLGLQVQPLLTMAKAATSLIRLSNPTLVLSRLPLSFMLCSRSALQ